MVSAHETLLFLEEAVQRVHSTGGITFHAASLAEPPRGYVVNRVGPCPKVPEEDFFSRGPALLHSFLTEHAEGLASSWVGVWHDTSQGLVVLDRVDLVFGLKEALSLARSRSQRSLWDVAAGAELPLD